MQNPLKKKKKRRQLYIISKDGGEMKGQQRTGVTHCLHPQHTPAQS